MVNLSKCHNSNELIGKRKFCRQNLLFITLCCWLRLCGYCRKHTKKREIVQSNIEHAKCLVLSVNTKYSKWTWLMQCQRYRANKISISMGLKEKKRRKMSVFCLVSLIPIKRNLLSLCAKLFICVSCINRCEWIKLFIENGSANYARTLVSVSVRSYTLFFLFTLIVVTWVILKINYNQGVSLFKSLRTSHVVNHCKYTLTAIPTALSHYYTIFTLAGNVKCWRPF